MHILILGGGVFLGAAVLRTRARARPRAHRLQPRPRAQRLARRRRGDRRRPRGRPRRASPGKRFDAVIDTCGYAPADVRDSAAALRDVQDLLLRLEHLGVRLVRHPPIREIDPLADFSKIDPADRDLRALRRRRRRPARPRSQKVFGERALIVRPGLIVGPGDRSGRFSHWPWRALEGGEMLVPDLRRRRAAAVHRRARPRRLDRPPGRARRARRLQRHRAGERPGAAAGAS